MVKMKKRFKQLESAKGIFFNSETITFFFNEAHPIFETRRTAFLCTKKKMTDGFSFLCFLIFFFNFSVSEI